MRARDIIGIVIGIPAFILGALAGLGALRFGLYWGLVSVTLVFVSVGLFIPRVLYQRSAMRAIGFTALSAATALVAGCVVAFGVHLRDSLHEVAGDDASALLFIAVGCLTASVFPFLGACMLQWKVSLGKGHLAASIAAGTTALALGVVLFYAWYR